MTENELGHVYPQIDEDKCVGCNLCQMSCPVVNKPLLRYPNFCFAVALLKDEDLKFSASGGASTALMRAVINEMVSFMAVQVRMFFMSIIYEWILCKTLKDCEDQSMSNLKLD